MSVKDDRLNMIDPSERVAIVGIGGVFPGAPDPERFWSNVAAGVDATSEVPPGRWSIDSVLGWRLSGRRWGLITLISALAVGIFVLQVWGLGVGGSPAPPPGP